MSDQGSKYPSDKSGKSNKKVGGGSLTQSTPASTRGPVEVDVSGIMSEVLERVSRELVPVIVEKISHKVKVWSGPTPPLEYLQGFEKLVPGAAERFLNMYECESDNFSHRKNANSHPCFAVDSKNRIV